jgi:hypothetical protein
MIKCRIKDIPYWIRTHTVDKYHLVDIRQPKDSPDQYAYRWGFIDASESMTLAVFKVFCEFFEKELFPMFCWSEKEDKTIKRDFLEVYNELKKTDIEEKDYILSDGYFDSGAFEADKSRHEDILECFEIYKWWTVDRIKRCKEDDEASIAWYNHRLKLLPNYWFWNEEEREQDKKLFEASMEAERILDDEEEQMLIRIMKIRGFLWT